MRVEDVDTFFSSKDKKLPGSPAWRAASRSGEVRARLPIEVFGAVSEIEMEITLKIDDPSYFVVVLIAPPCIARLCMTGGHNNRITGERTEGPHFHSWPRNRHLSRREAATLPFCEPVPAEITNRDDAFSWFLHQVGIESPDWLPVIWPTQGGLFG